MLPKNAEGIANSVDPDQTARLWVCTVYPDVYVRKLMIITVYTLWLNSNTITVNWIEIFVKTLKTWVLHAVGSTSACSKFNL